MDIKKQSTEARNQNTYDIDSVSTLEMVAKINNEDKQVAVAVEKELKNIAKAVDLTAENFLKGGRLVYLGAGTSGRICVLDAYDCPATYGIEDNKVLAIMAGGNSAITGTAEGAEDVYENGAKDLQAIKLNNNDTLVVLSASGNTPYVLGAVEYAKTTNTKTISVTNNVNAKVVNMVDIAINVITGQEAITGSTRMKAGTAQKLVLNILSTGLMVKLGKVYQNLMIDVKPLNAKLVERVKSMVIETTNCSTETAEQALKDANGNAKIAILIIEKNINAKEAQEKLKQHSDKLSDALRN